MKKINFICVFLVIAVVLTAACDGKNYADHSEDVKYVSAAFYLSESINDKEDRLIKNAELIYTKMSVVPKGNISAAGVEFDAKLKNEGTEKFYLKIYVTNSEKTLDIDKYKTLELQDSYQIEITGNLKKITVQFDRPYNFNFEGLENDITNSYKLCLEFQREGGAKNTDVVFSLDNVDLLAA